MNIRIGLLCLISAAMLMAGCSNTSDEQDSQASETSSMSSAEDVSSRESDSETENTANDSSQTDENLSDDKVKNEFRFLFEEAIDCCNNGDTEGFKELFRDPENTADTINGVYSAFQDLIALNYPDFNYSVIYSSNNYYLCYFVNSLTTGTSPNLNYMSFNDSITMSFIDGEWKFDYTSAAYAFMSEIDFSSNVPSVPDECKAAIIAGRNASQLTEKDLSWVKNDTVIPGIFKNNIYLMWQNEDGSVSCMVNFQNGTDQIKYIKEAAVSVEDSVLGTIAQGTFDIDESLAPGVNKNYVITFAAEDVITGTQIWNAVSAVVDSVTSP